MKQVKIQNVTPNDNPRFIKTNMIEATRDGVPFKWEMVKSMDSVHIAVYNKSNDTFIFVKQVRVPVLVNNPETDGTVIECCAGLVDKDASLAQIAKEEILEELGFDVPTDSVVFQKTCLSSVGTAGTNSNIFTCIVDESQRVSQGGGLPTEDIQVMTIPRDQVMDFLFEQRTDATTLFATSILLNQL